MKRKALALILAIAMTFALAACGSSGSESTPSGGSSSDSAADVPASIKVGVINCSTGVLAAMGEGTPWTEDYFTDYINNTLGGIYFEDYGKKLPVEVKIYDNESSVTKASELTAKAITEDGVDVILARHTPDLVVPISAVADSYGVPCIAFDCPLGPWIANGPYEWAFLAHTDSPTYVKAYSSIWKAAGYVAGEPNATIGLIFANDTDGTVLSPQYKSELEKDGWTCLDPGLYTAGTTDYSNLIQQYKDNNIEVIFGTMVNPEFAAFWVQCQQMGYQPKIVVVGKAYMLESQALAVGADLMDGICLEGWWHESFPYNSDITGMTNQEFAAKYAEEMGVDCNAPEAANFASWEVMIDALTRAANLEPETVREAIAATDLNTVMGHVVYQDDNGCPLPCVGAQWVLQPDGSLKQEIVSNGEPSNGISTTAEIKTSGFAWMK
jgi:branched-chain amino acid transport system substrate-binding protein